MAVKFLDYEDLTLAEAKTYARKPRASKPGTPLVNLDPPLSTAKKGTKRPLDDIETIVDDDSGTGGQASGSYEGNTMLR